MKIYLFLYPIRECFENGMISTALLCHLPEQGHRVKRLSDITKRTLTPA